MSNRVYAINQREFGPALVTEFSSQQESELEVDRDFVGFRIEDAGPINVARYKRDFTEFPLRPEQVRYFTPTFSVDDYEIQQGEFRRVPRQNALGQLVQLVERMESRRPAPPRLRQVTQIMPAFNSTYFDDAIRVIDTLDNGAFFCTQYLPTELAPTLKDGTKMKLEQRQEVQQIMAQLQTPKLLVEFRELFLLSQRIKYAQVLKLPTRDLGNYVAKEARDNPALEIVSDQGLYFSKLSS